MAFLKTSHLGLILPILGVFLAFSGSIWAMETVYGNLAPQASWTHVAMNDGRSASIPANSQNPVTFWTDELKGCVVTLINLEHQNGDRTVAMCHFSHDKKSYNEFYLSGFLSNLERENKLNSFKKASCIIIPPGIPTDKKITPIIDQEWKRLIVETMRAHIPSINIRIEPYLFNTDSSCVKYTVDSKNARGMIINKSKQADREYQNLLLVCHNHKEDSLCNKLLPLLLATSGLIGFFIYNSH